MNNISLDKKYKTVSGLDVKLYEQFDTYVIGAFYSFVEKRWISGEWEIVSGYFSGYLGYTGISPSNFFNLVEIPEFKCEEIIFSQNRFRTVDYFGVNIAIPNGFNYIATCISGKVYAFNIMPVINALDRWEYGDGEFVDSIYCAVGSTDLVANIKFSGDWKKSLKYFP